MGAGAAAIPINPTNLPAKINTSATSGAKPNAASPTDKRAADLLVKLPVRNATQRKTSGYWIDDDGTEQGPLVSGHTDGYQEANEELRRLGIAPERGELWTAAHVEVKLAVRLRLANAKHVMLVVNKKPCSRDMWSCDELLPRILKPGQRLTVHWPDGGKRTYQGREA